jgi:hypothetical protein
MYLNTLMNAIPPREAGFPSVPRPPFVFAFGYFPLEIRDWLRRRGCESEWQDELDSRLAMREQWNRA